MLEESITGLNISPDGIYVDVTFGGGGHSEVILNNLKKGRLIAFDQDEEAIKNAQNDERIIFINANYSFLKNFLSLHGFFKVDGILADLGISSYQINTPERGFSTRFDGTLDLRMNKNGDLTAREIINTYDKENLKRIFKNYGELLSPGRIADEIISSRLSKEIISTFDLIEILKKFTNPKTANKFFAQVFQALRIEVNNEIEVLKMLLTQSAEVLKKGGRLVVISYHSLEDRLVKNFMKSGNFEGIVETDFFGNKLTPFKMITGKPLTAKDAELAINNRARSAKLRIAEKN